MEIKIIDEYNHQEISVALSADINSEIEFYKDNIFVENGLYSIFINFETDNNISYVRMFLEDICLDVQFDEFTNTAYLYKKRIFEDCETYENQMILGFIHSIILYINDKCLELEKIIKEFENEIPYDEIKKLPKDYDLAYNSVIFHYKELFRILKNYSETFENLFDAYSSRLQCDLITVTSVPNQYTKRGNICLRFFFFPKNLNIVYHFH